MFPIIDKQRTGQRIRMLMKQQNITVKQIQEYLSLSCVQGIYHWLDGTSMPTVAIKHSCGFILSTYRKEYYKNLQKNFTGITDFFYIIQKYCFI